MALQTFTDARGSSQAPVSAEWPVEVVSIRDQVIYDSASGTALHIIDLTPNAQIRKRKKAPGECASRPNQFDTLTLTGWLAVGQAGSVLE